MNGHGMKGLAGQGMSGVRAVRTGLRGIIDSVGGASSYTAPRSCTAIIVAWSAGGIGTNNSTGPGGGGGAAGYKVVHLGAGQTISWSAGATSGADTTVTVPGGRVLSLTGGATPVGGLGGLGGVPSAGWDLARQGGQGGRGGAGVNTAGESPPGGGSGGALSGDMGGGGGAAGFSDLMAGTSGGNGGQANASTPNNTAPGGGQGGGFASGVSGGAPGRVLLILVEASQV